MMSLDKKDKAIMQASLLIGYCESYPTRFQALSDSDRDQLERWFSGLIDKTKKASSAIDEVLSETSGE